MAGCEASAISLKLIGKEERNNAENESNEERLFLVNNEMAQAVNAAQNNEETTSGKTSSNWKLKQK